MIMAFIGGSWMPLEMLPAFVRRLAPFTINYWAIDGYKRLLFADAGLVHVVGHKIPIRINRTAVIVYNDLWRRALTLVNGPGDTIHICISDLQTGQRTA